MVRRLSMMSVAQSPSGKKKDGRTNLRSSWKWGFVIEWGYLSLRCNGDFVSIVLVTVKFVLRLVIIRFAGSVMYVLDMAYRTVVDFDCGIERNRKSAIADIAYQTG